MSIARFILAAARRLPDHPALTDARGTFTYAEFADRAARIAGTWRADGLGPGERVILYMENCGAFFECLLGCWIAGLCPVPVNAKLHPREVAGIAADSAARLLVTNPGRIVEMASAACAAVPSMRIIGTDGDDYRQLLAADPTEPAEARPTDNAWLFYTSGTTGRPKGAILSHRNLCAMSFAYYADIDMLDERDTHLHFAPVSHASGLYSLPHLMKGGHQVVFPGFDVEQLLDALTRYQNVSLFAAPTMLTRLVRHPAAARSDFSSLKTIYYGGAPMYVADLEAALRLLGPKLCQVYGQGETPMTITALPKRLHGTDAAVAPADVLGSCGFARTGQEVKVVDVKGRELPPGEVGEIVTRGDCVMEGYWNNPKGTAEALRDGWLYTGDVGSFDARGYLTLRDRSKDLIISGGSNIYPREVEEVLLRHGAVLEVSVVGHPHTDWGEEVVAFVVAKPGQAVSAAELDQLCLDNIARFKRPKHYRFVDALPKSNLGKILKTELRRHLAAEDLAAEVSA